MKATEKIKKFLYSITYPYRKLKAYHQIILQLDQDKSNNSPYHVFFGWLLDIAQYGVILSIILCWVKTQNQYLMIPALGLLYWFWLDFIKQTSNQIRGN